MSRILRNNLWSVMIAWSLILTGHELSAIAAVFSASVYICAFSLKGRHLSCEDDNGIIRPVMVFVVCSFLTTVFIEYVGMDISSFALFVFLILVSLNCALVSCYLSFCYDSDLHAAMLFDILFFAFFLAGSLFFGIFHIILTLMIFLPYTAVMSMKVFEQTRKVPFSSYDIRV